MRCPVGPLGPVHLSSSKAGRQARSIPVQSLYTGCRSKSCEVSTLLRRSSFRRARAAQRNTQPTEKQRLPEAWQQPSFKRSRTSSFGRSPFGRSPFWRSPFWRSPFGRSPFWGSPFGRQELHKVGVTDQLLTISFKH